MLDGAVLAGGVHGLKDEQCGPIVLGVELFLQGGELFDALLQEVAGLLLGLVAEVGGVAGVVVGKLEALAVRDLVLLDKVDDGAGAGGFAGGRFALLVLGLRVFAHVISFFSYERLRGTNAGSTGSSILCPMGCVFGFSKSESAMHIFLNRRLFSFAAIALVAMSVGDLGMGQPAEASNSNWTIKTGQGEEISVNNGWFGGKSTVVKDRMGDKIEKKKGWFGSGSTEVNLLGNSLETKKGLLGRKTTTITTLTGDKIERKNGWFRNSTTIDASGASNMIGALLQKRAADKSAAAAAMGAGPAAAGIDSAFPPVSPDAPAVVPNTSAAPEFKSKFNDFPLPPANANTGFQPMD